MTEDLDVWKVFLAVFNEGSVQDAAVKLNMESSSVSKKLQKLEKLLGVQLFDRTGRPFLPTPTAYELFPYAESMIHSLEKISNILSDRVCDDSQIIRLMIGNTHAKYMPKMIQQYVAQNPRTRVNVIAPLDVEEFKQRLADIAFISGVIPLPDCVLLSRGKMVFMPVASKEYLEKNGPIETLQDLEHHHIFSSLYPSRYAFSVNYVLRKGAEVMNIPKTTSIRWSNVEMAKQAVLQGIGISLGFPLFHCIDEIERGELVPILNGWHRPSQENYVAIHTDDWKKPYLRRFADYMAKEFAKTEASCEARLKKAVPKALYDEYLR